MAAFLAATARWLVWPTQDRPTHADAIVVFGGDGDRFGEAVTLAQAGYASTLVVSIDKYPGSPCDQGASTYGLSSSIELICFLPDPFTTRGEARYLADLSNQRGWSHVIVVTNTAQATRAKIRIDRCWGGDLDFISVRPDFRRSVRDVIHEWGALGKALLFERSC